MSPDQTDSWAIASAIAGIVAAVGGAFAAYAAYRSARSADDAAKRAEELERRGLFRDVVIAANNMIAETLRVDDLGTRLKREYETLAIFSGGSGGSRVQLQIREIDRKRSECGPIQQQAHAALEGTERLRSAPEQDLVDLLTKFDRLLIQVRRVKEKFSHDLGVVESQNQSYRQNALRGPGDR